MARPKTEELTKHTLNLRAGDLEQLALLFPGKSPTTIVRRIVSKFIDNVRKTQENPVSSDDISL